MKINISIAIATLSSRSTSKTDTISKQQTKNKLNQCKFSQNFKHNQFFISAISFVVVSQWLSVVMKFMLKFLGKDFSLKLLSCSICMCVQFFSFSDECMSNCVAYGHHSFVGSDENTEQRLGVW